MSSDWELGTGLMTPVAPSCHVPSHRTVSLQSPRQVVQRYEAGRQLCSMRSDFQKVLSSA
eukprot:2013701-Amphidinium_carterae.1